MRALIKRLAHYSPIDTPTIVSFVHFLMDPEPHTTLHVNFSCTESSEGRCQGCFDPSDIVAPSRE